MSCLPKWKRTVRNVWDNCFCQWFLLSCHFPLTNFSHAAINLLHFFYCIILSHLSILEITRAKQIWLWSILCYLLNHDTFPTNLAFDCVKSVYTFCIQTIPLSTTNKNDQKLAMYRVQYRTFAMFYLWDRIHEVEKLGHISDLINR